MRYFKHQQGATLIEIMVSILVMAIGLLGLASLQINAMKFQKTASQRSEATQAAYDLGERMRSNWVISSVPPANLAADKIANATKYTYREEYTVSSAATHTPPNNCRTLTCDTNQIAANDLQEWLRSLQRRLIGGTGIIVPVAGGAEATFDVTVMWKEPSFSDVDANCPAVANAPAGVRCFNLRFSI
ncbi:type IV pilus modification protein PilV [Undibacterium flavidum]|uniref:Type IV pilus modification protein PilV n=1 Tax=Undibacterium flavidum TaxID=2762297 RepID=A0ABR6YDI1_9BURK|nr:type IV pilus modification protein PilV [Undibacterium flavidum]MBC3874613.1 type IV pilus modification protein PilV [Undibacterium flavidum]